MDKEVSEQLKKATELFFEHVPTGEHEGEWEEPNFRNEDEVEGKREIYQCNCCGRTFTEKGDIDFTPNFFHDFAAYTGYGSPLDDEKIKFTLCELCLMEIMRKFKHQPTCDGVNVVDWFDRVKGSYYEDLEHLERR